MSSKNGMDIAYYNCLPKTYTKSRQSKIQNEYGEPPEVLLENWGAMYTLWLLKEGDSFVDVAIESFLMSHWMAPH